MEWRLKGVVGRGSASWDEWVVGRASAAEVGCWSWLGRGWVVAEVAPVGFKSWLGRGRCLLRSCLGFKSAPVMIFFYRRGFVFVCVCVCVCGFC